MKEVSDREKFQQFADAHRKSVQDRVLSDARARCEDPTWTPTGALSGGGLWFSAKVEEQIKVLYRRAA